MNRRDYFGDESNGQKWNDLPSFAFDYEVDPVKFTHIIYDLKLTQLSYFSGWPFHNNER